MDPSADTCGAAGRNVVRVWPPEPHRPHRDTPTNRHADAHLHSNPYPNAHTNTYFHVNPHTHPKPYGDAQTYKWAKAELGKADYHP